PPRSTTELNLDTEKFSSFSALRGRMIWPLAKGKVIRSSGEDRNKKLNTVTINYGVDIKSTGDMDVKAVAEGIVSAIDWIPGYGSVIIITHKGDYRTVYSHLSEIFISEGDKVKMGTRIAKVGESLEGNILHFEIWNSRKNQDPEVWLARK
ncbi:MAG: M23 family metallopeptidase, partial [Ignavibacteriaceae bacterium]|nr:M23 family metallopeptidase [Ignavibacteriaceae bacterium]